MAAEGIKIIADNRKARHDYELLERVEAGIVLTGAEVKSLREGKLTLSESYCRVESDGAVYLVDAHIPPYTHGNRFNLDPVRRRKLLLHRTEIRRLNTRVRERGLTLVPTKVYFKRGIVKVEIALAKGKRLHDKRDTIKKRDVQREVARAMQA
ncbi:MAG: SsrA-binding protein SmpB [Candidatus Lambdaproteobacteria bacterium]|nr:SsrA-binding protein SmpB [Candidatus Lambdaproteobacteria bacterium]